MTGTAIARGFRDAGSLIAIGGAWILLWVALVTVERGSGPGMAHDQGAHPRRARGGSSCAGRHRRRSLGASSPALGRGQCFRLRAAVAQHSPPRAFACGVYVSAVWARKLVRERSEDLKQQEMARRDHGRPEPAGRDLGRKSSRLRRGSPALPRRCPASRRHRGPPVPAVRASGWTPRSARHCRSTASCPSAKFSVAARWRSRTALRPTATSQCDQGGHRSSRGRRRRGVVPLATRSDALEP